MTERVEFAVALTVRSPFLFRGLAGGLVGLDAAQLRDEQRRAVLPADQLRGVLGEALDDLADAAPDVIKEQEIRELFGSESPEFKDAGEYNRPERGRLIASDLVADAKGLLETTRVEIDDATGAAKSGHLQMVELPAPFGTEVTFAGNLVAHLAAEKVERVAAALDKALRLVAAIGAFKSAGFGAVVDSRVAIASRQTLAQAAPKGAAGGRQGFAAAFDRPILVDAERVAENAFRGSAIVPGAVWKGALARKLELMGGPAMLARFDQALAALAVSHAFPAAPDADRPQGEPLPLSLAAIDVEGKRTFADALRIPRDGKRPSPDAGPRLRGDAMRFQADWKPHWPKEARELLGCPYSEPAEMPRTHTRISEFGTAAEAQLFTTVARSTRVPHNPDAARPFLFTIDTAGVPPAEQENAAILVGILAEGLDNIGRTGATATFDRWPSGDVAPAASPVQGHADLFAVVLRTPGALTDPATQATAREAYEAYWAAVAPGAELIDFCAAQRLAGGYLATRRRPFEAYHPFVLTEAGSVFLLAGSIRARLETLIRTGLPVPAFAGAAQLDWRNCPFVPGNGFGEIRVDHLSHSLKPAAEAKAEWAAEIEHV